jgi:beta-1,4-mannosyltransferase
LRPAPKKPDWLPFLIYAPLKVIFQSIMLLGCLLFVARPSKWLLVQNPPSIPTLMIASLVCALQQRRLIIDWHNYGYTILAGVRGVRHPFVAISRKLEFFFAQFADLHLAVTNAMARQLRSAPYHLKAPVLAVHDRPASIFQPILDPNERLAVLTKLLSDERKTFVRAITQGTVRMVISSTSWTPDEDFGILLDALTRYAADDAVKSTTAAKGFVHTPLLVVITGKGPQKALYEAKIAALEKASRLPNVQFIMAFLPFEDYARLLAVADLGVCLHKSSSGVDLPMKVVDMFGAGIPVAAYSGYESFSELVREGENGCGFENAEELAQILVRLLGREGRAELEHLRRGAVKEGARRWDAEWDPTVGRALSVLED